MSVTALSLLIAAAGYLGFQWTIRVLVYPQFANVGRAELAAYEQAHQRLVSWAVGPLFAALILACAAVTVRPPPGTARWLVWSGDALTALVLVVTALLAVPLHRTLSAGFDRVAHRRLLGVDTIRLLAAGANVVVAVALLAQSAR
jgi:hypothetical protein